MAAGLLSLGFDAILWNPIRTRHLGILLEAIEGKNLQSCIHALHEEKGE